MERFIGLDVHASSSTFGIIGPSGKRIRSQVVATRAPDLIEVLKELKGNLHLCLEEGTQSSWLYEILSPHVAEMVVTKVGEKKRRGPKSDVQDAFALAEQLRMGTVEGVVFKEQGGMATLRQLVKAHVQIVRDVVRAANRIRALYRSRGVTTTGLSIYSPTGRGEYLSQLPSSARAAAEHLYAQYDSIVPVRKQAEKAVVNEARRHGITRILTTCPGMGDIRVAQLIATVVTPHRFRTTRQFWSYCGLGIVMRTSSDWVQTPDGKWQRQTVRATRGLNRDFNRMLKSVFKGAATTVIGNVPVDHPMRSRYLSLTKAGTKPNLAKLTLARKIAATCLAMWKNQERYDPTRSM